jgi:hypothetical protein
VAHGVGPEFKPQYYKKKKKMRMGMMRKWQSTCLTQSRSWVQSLAPHTHTDTNILLAWWWIPIITALRRITSSGQPGYIARPCFKKAKQNNRKSELVKKKMSVMNVCKLFFLS